MMPFLLGLINVLTRKPNIAILMTNRSVDWCI